MKKMKYFFLFVLLAFFAIGNNTVNASEFLVSDESEFVEVRQEAETTTIKLNNDITLDDTRPTLNVYNDYIIDLNGHDLYIRKFLMVYYYTNNITVTFIDSSADKTGRITTNPTSNPITIRRGTTGTDNYVGNFIFDGITFEQVDIVGTIFDFTAKDTFTLNIKIHNSNLIVDDSILMGEPSSMDYFSFDIYNTTITAVNRSVTISKWIEDWTFGDIVDTTKSTIKGIPENSTIMEEISADTLTTNYYEKIIVEPKTPSFEVSIVKFDALDYGYENVAAKAIPIKALVEARQIKTVEVSGDAFVVTGNKTPTLQPEEINSTDFTIKPKDGLAAGTYTETITVTDMNNNEFTSTVTFKVNKKKVAYPVPVTPEASFVYDGTEKEFLVTGFDENIMITGGGIATDAGTHSADFGLKDIDNYEWEDGTNGIIGFKWHITKASIKKPEAITRTFTYDGTEKEIVVSNYDSSILDVVDNIKVTPGAYGAKYTIKNTNNCEWEDGTTDTVIIPWTIQKAKIKKPVATNTEFTYNGTKQELVVENFDSNVMTVENNAKTGVGVYTATYSLVSWNYYEWEDETQSDVTIEWKINKAELDKPTASIVEFDYDKSEKELVLTGFDSNTMKVEDNVKTNAGEYTATITLLDVANYRWSDKTVTPATIDWKINKVVVDVPHVEYTEFEYDGTEKVLTITGLDESIISIKGNKQTDPGRYGVTFTLLDTTNYVWEDGRTTPQTIEWIITGSLIKKGDINKDGLVDSADAAIALNIFKYNNATAEDLKIGDMDENGMIDSADAAMILNIFKYSL